MLKVAFLTTDNRENARQYELEMPFFGTAPQALLEGFSSIPNLEVHVISCTQRQMLSPMKLSNNTWFHSLHVPKLGWLRSGYSGCVFAVRRKLRDIQPDIVHGQGTERECAISAVFSGYPSVVTLHGVMNALAQLHKARFGSYLRCAALIERLALKQCTGIICISPYVMNMVEQYKARKWLVPNAIQNFFFDSPPSSRPFNKAPLIINVGVISERKRQVELLEIFCELAKEVNPFKVLFVGKLDPSNKYAATFQSRLNSLRKQQHFPFNHIEFLDSERFVELYDDASLMVHFSSEESFGLTFAEALARNLPLIASDVGAALNICEGIPSAKVLRPDDFPALRSALCNFLAHQKPGPQLFYNSSDIIASRYHPKVIANRHLEIYREVLSGRSSS